MKRIPSLIVIMSLAGMLFSVSLLHAGTDGEELFHSRTLGTNGKSCADCHPQGKGLQEIASYSDSELREMINFCIRDALGGKLLPADADELEHLKTYLHTLQH